MESLFRSSMADGIWSGGARVPNCMPTKKDLPMTSSIDTPGRKKAAATCRHGVTVSDHLGCNRRHFGHRVVPCVALTPHSSRTAEPMEEPTPRARTTNSCRASWHHT